MNFTGVRLPQLHPLLQVWQLGKDLDQLDCVLSRMLLEELDIKVAKECSCELMPTAPLCIEPLLELRTVD